MARKYDNEAVELCRSLYLKYGGTNYAAIEADMRKVYPGWGQNNLFDKGRVGTRNERMGWITKYGFENSMRLETERKATAVNNDEQDLYLGIKTIRKTLQLEACGKKADAAVRREFREYAKIEIEARRNLDLSRDNFETFVSGYEKLLMWTGDLDPETAKRLIKLGPKLADLAQAHYGKEAIDDGAEPGKDEGGGGEAPHAARV